MFSLIAGSSPNYERQTGRGTLTEGVKGEKEAYLQVRNLILGHLKVRPSQVTDFRIHFQSQTASFTDPATKEVRVVDLPNLKDEGIQRALKHYYDITPNARYQMKFARVSGGSKGDRSGEKPLRKTTQALQALSTDYEKTLPHALAAQSDPRLRPVIARRVLFAEYFLDKWKGKISARIEERKERFKQPGLTSAQVSELKKELRELHRMQAELENIDMYALTKILTKYPVGRLNKAQTEQFAEQLEQAVLADIQPKKWFGAKKAAHSEADKAYAKDVAGMVFFDRRSYFDFCRKNFGKMKSDSVSDVFLREALQFVLVRDGEEYDAKGFEESYLLSDMPDELKEQLQGDLHAIGVVATHAVPTDDPRDYTDKSKCPDYTDETNFPADATDRLKATYQAGKMEDALKKHKEAVNTQMELKDVRAPAQRQPGVQSLAVSAAGAAVGAAAVVGVGSYMGWIDPQAAWVLFQNHAPIAVAGISLIDSFRNRAVAYFAPLNRDPITGRVTRQVSYGRVAFIGVSVAALGAFAWYTGSGSAITHSSMDWTSWAVNGVWNNSWLPVSNPRVLPLLGWQWQGTVPMVAALQAGRSLANRIPIVRHIAGPVFRALRNTQVASNLASATSEVGSLVGFSASGVAEYGAQVYSNAERMATNRARATAEHVNALWLFLVQMQFFVFMSQAFRFVASPFSR